MPVEKLEEVVAARAREAEGSADRRFARIEVAARPSGGRVLLSGFATDGSLVERLEALLAGEGIAADASGIEVLDRAAPREERAAIAPVVHLRDDPNDGSSLLTQCVLGEAVEVLREREGWLLVRGADGYLGWAKKSAFASPGDPSPSARGTGAGLRVTANLAIVREGPAADAAPARLAPFDSRLNLLDRVEHRILVGFADGSAGWIAAEEAREESAMARYPRAGAIVERARGMLGVPYLWGGTTPLGFDCSGLVQRLYGHFGVFLPRDADLQKRAIETSWGGFESEPGDLYFFGREKATHVGISLGGGDFLHASAWVRIESLDETSRFYRADLAASFLGTGRIPVLGRS